MLCILRAAIKFKLTFSCIFNLETTMCKSIWEWTYFWNFDYSVMSETREISNKIPVNVIPMRIEHSIDIVTLHENLHALKTSTILFKFSDCSRLSVRIQWTPNYFFQIFLSKEKFNASEIGWMNKKAFNRKQFLYCQLFFYVRQLSYKLSFFEMNRLFCFSPIRHLQCCNLWTLFKLLNDLMFFFDQFLLLQNH